jgi:hypothetical protein
MALEPITQQELQVWDRPENVVKQLEKFRDDIQKTDAKVEEIWAKFRTLPGHAMYLIASHDRYGEWRWSGMTKWQIVKQFDIKLRTNQADKLLVAVNSAIETEKKIIALEKLYATLSNSSLDVTMKLKEMEGWADQNRNNPVSQEVLDKVNFVSQVSLERNRPQPKIDLIIKEMLFLYKQGHLRLDNIHFTNLH